MKNTLVVVVGILLTAASVALYFHEPAAVSQVSRVAYDGLIRATQVPAQSDQVVIVDIDEESLEAFGQWPWPRYRVAELTSRLFEQGASVVAFDVVFQEVDRTSPGEFLAELNQHFGASAELANIPLEAQDFDQLFADALRTGPSVLGCFVLSADSPTQEPGAVDGPFDYLSRRIRPNARARLHQAMVAELPLPRLADAARGLGFINAQTDSDNIVRSTPLVWAYDEDQLAPSLALEALRLHLGCDLVAVNNDETGITEVALRDLRIPTDPWGNVLINYRNLRSGTDRSVPYVSAVDVVEGTAESSIFSNRIVFVGTSAIGLRDTKATPLTDTFAGVETHATLVDNILAGDVLRKPAVMELMEILALLVTGLMLTVCIQRGRPWLAVSFTLLLVVFAVWASYFLMDRYNLVFVPARLLMAVAAIYAVLTSIRYWQEESRRKKLRQVFGAQVSQKVLSFMEENPDSFSLQGHDADVSVFFSDIAGFTPIAESLDAESVRNLLNQYLSPMNRIIQARDGFVDKYQGDAIMAVWGAPYSMENHAAQACLSALEQHAEMASLQRLLKARFGVDVFVRMGINSGLVKAGNMGSEDRNQYTVIGDVVNQAARLEPINKHYRTSIMIGQSTYAQARDAIEARLVDRIVVKGKTEPIEIYELLAPKGELSAAQSQLVELYEEALRWYWSRRWEDAIRNLDEIDLFVPDDGPSAVLRARIEEFRSRPPASEWNGAHAFASK